jgi:KipI family sensor histidine kinase inhibitor
MADDFRIVPAGDAVVVVSFAERIDLVVNQHAVELAERFRNVSLTGVRDVVSTFRSVAVYFDPLRTDYQRMLDELRRLASSEPPAQSAARPPIEIPVKYGGEFGPDLADVARFAKASEQDVVRMHSGRHIGCSCWDSFQGLLIWGPSISALPPLDAPIRAPPSRRARSAFAGPQTGIYPSEIPGGWQLIGRTAIRPFDLSRANACLFNPGDTVRFVAVEGLS